MSDRFRREEKGRQQVAYPIPTDEEVLAVLDDHELLFMLQDRVYSCLRLIDPTEEEMSETREAIKMMEIKWKEMELSETPKAHLIFKHAANDQKEFGGIGDKIEDDVERIHQKQVHYDSITMRMSDQIERLKTQARMQWRDSDPRVNNQIEKVHGKTKRRVRNGRNVVSMKIKRKAQREIKREEAMAKMRFRE